MLTSVLFFSPPWFAVSNNLFGLLRKGITTTTAAAATISF